MRRGEKLQKGKILNKKAPTRSIFNLSVPLKRARLALDGALAYARANKRTLVKNSILYSLLWLAELLSGVAVEYIVLAAGLACLVIDLYIGASRALGESHPLNLLKKKLTVKKRPSRVVRADTVLLSTLFVNARGFLTNPFARIAEAGSLRLLDHIWAVAILAALWDLFLHLPLAMWLGHQPKGHQSFVSQADLMVVDFLCNHGLCFNQSHIIGLGVSLAAFLVLTGHTFLIKGQNPLWYAAASAKALASIAAPLAFLEWFRALAMDWILDNVIHDGAEFGFQHAVLCLALLQISMIRVYYLCWNLGRQEDRHSALSTFKVLVKEAPSSSSCRSTRLTVTFLNKVPPIVAFSVLCFSYLAVRALVEITVGL